MIICTECGNYFKVKSYFKNKFKCPFCDEVFKLTDYKAIRWINGIFTFVFTEVTLLIALELKYDYHMSVLIPVGISLVVGTIIAWLLQKYILIKLFNRHYSKISEERKP